MIYIILFLLSLTAYSSDTTNCIEAIAKKVNVNLNNERGLSEEAKTRKDMRILGITALCLKYNNDIDKVSTLLEKHGE